MTYEQGLISACFINPEGKGKDLDWQAVRDWSPVPGLLWIHLDYNHPDASSWLHEKSGLDPLVVESLCAEETRPHYTVFENGLLITLRGVNLNPGADPEDMVAIRMWLDRQRVITTRRRCLLSESIMVRAIQRGQGPLSSAEFLTDFSYHMIEHMAEVIDDIDTRVDKIEIEILDGNISGSQPVLAELLKQIVSLRRYLAPQRDVMLRLSGERLIWFDDRDRLHLKQIADTIIRYIEDLDESREQIKILQELMLNQITNQTNKRMYLLSIIAAIFLPLSFVTGLLGINVGGIPGTGYPFAFTIVSVSLVSIAAMVFLLLKFKKWM